jgi:hypothetical protein
MMSDELFKLFEMMLKRQKNISCNKEAGAKNVPLHGSANGTRL